MDKLTEIFDKVTGTFTGTYMWIPIILLLTAIFYYTFRTLNKNNAQLLGVLFIVFVVATGVVFMSVETKDSLMGLSYFIVPCLFVIAVIALFGTEIKRDIWERGSKKTGEIKTRHVDKSSQTGSVNDYIDEIVKALQNMSKNDVGAIIILANDNMPKSVIESGVVLDSFISSQLIESVFFPKTPLHDGAMIINGTKIHAAGCFLPLSQEVNLPKDLGTRHRAGIGITETINVTSLIVSEETGIISIAQGGRIKRYADSEMLRQTLKEYYWQEFLDKKK
ncbi:MAG TPA: hypothetical protein DDW54_02535 [Clostridiales bacterium]|nr:hypothetical protein [Clostridiales bacterium]